MHFFKSRFFKIAFLSYVLLITALVVVFGIVLGLQQNNETKRLQEKDVQAKIDKMVQVADDKFDTIELMSLQLSGSNWMPYVASESDVLFSQMGYFERRDVCDEVFKHNTLLQVSQFSAILFPQKNLVVDGADFWELNHWLELKGMDADLVDQINSIHPSFHSALILLPNSEQDTSGSFVVAKKLKNDASIKGIFLTQVNEKHFLKFVETYLPEATRFAIVQQEQTIYTTPQTQPSEKTVELMVPSKVYSWSYRIAIEAEDRGGVIPVWQAVIALLGMILLVVLVAYPLARFTHLPIFRLLKRINPQKDGELYDLDKLEYMFEELDLENKKLKSLANQYLQIGQNNLLNSLLLGNYDRSQIYENTRKFQIDFDENMVYMVAILRDPDWEKKEQLLNSFLDIEIHCAQQGITTALYVAEGTESYILIMGTGKENKSILEREESVVVLIDEYLADLDVDIYTGRIYEGFEGIFVSHREAKEKMLLSANQKEQLSYYYPVDVEMNLNRHVQMGDFEKAEQLLRMLEQENQSRAVITDAEKNLIYILYEALRRFAEEWGVSANQWASAYLLVSGSGNVPEMWQFLRTMLADIQCAQLENDSIRARGMQFVKYVNEHYTNSNLSQQEIADQFYVSRSTVSKIFKETMQMNFVGYLSKLRVEHAKQLFLRENNDVMKVAKESGFETEVTFKRAFIKQEGMSPREFIKRCNQLKGVEE